MKRNQFLTLSIIFVILLSLPNIIHAYGRTPIPPTPRSHRIIVKLNAKMASVMEESLNSTMMEIEKDSASANAGLFLSKYRIKRMKPAFDQIVAWKKQTGRTEADLLFDIKSKYAIRAQRYQGAVETPELSRIYIIELEDTTENAFQEVLKELKKDANIEYAEEEKRLTIQMLPNDPFFSSRGSWGQSYDDLYGIKAIEAPSAWDTATGQGVTVAVVDTGIDRSHPDIAANIWKNTDEISGNGKDDDHNGYIDDTWGWNFVKGNNQPIDDHGHGTHVSGTIAAIGNNGIGVIGVAPNAKVMPLKCINALGYGQDPIIAKAIIYAANNGADVINLSLGDDEESRILEDAVNYAYKLGVVIVVAAGNDDSNVQKYYPASFNNVITVAASDAGDKKAYFSNWGNKIDVAAPGVDILSLRAANTDMGPPVDNYYTLADGTSMATPHVAGLAALILSAHPEFSNEQVRQVIRRSAQDVQASGFDINTGYGRINASHAVTMNEALEAHIESPVSGGSMTGSFEIKGSAKGPNFASYKLELGTGKGFLTASWEPIAQGTVPVSRGRLGFLDTATVPDGVHFLRLTVTDTNGKVYCDQIEIVIKYIGITSPNPPAFPNLASIYKPGSSIPIIGTTTRPGFQRFHLAWAEGLGKDVPWSTTGFTLTQDGYSPILEGQLGTWDTSVISGKAGYYQICLFVEGNGVTSEKRTVVYIEPELVHGQWPLMLEKSPGPENSVNIAQDEHGNSSLVLALSGDSSEDSGVFHRFSSEGKALYYTTYPQGFRGQAAVGNIDGEPGDESVVLVKKGDGSGYFVRVIKSDNTFYEFSTLAKDIKFEEASIQLRDMDGDGNPEILTCGTDDINHRKLLYAWTKDGTLLSSHYPLVVDENATTERVRFLAVDLNNDGKKEILFTQTQGETEKTTILNRFDWDGQPLAWSNGSISFDGIIQNMIAGDPDRDGQVEIIFSTLQADGNAKIYVLKPDGSIKEGWPISVPVSDCDFGLADMDRDGVDEIVISGNRKSNSRLYITILKPNGNPLSDFWPYTDDGRQIAGLSIGDVNNDSLPELVIAATTLKFYDPDTASIFTDSSANILKPETFTYLDGVQRSIRYLRTQSNRELMADYMEADAYFDSEMIVLNANAIVEKSWTIMGNIDCQPYLESDPVLGDFDGNGKVDIAVTYSEILHDGREQWLFGGIATLFTLEANYNADYMDWPMNFYNPQNSSVKLPKPTVASIGLDMDAYTVNAGLSKKITVTALLSDKTRMNVTKDATFSTENTDIATVDPDGTIHGMTSGETTLTVTCEGHTATAKINVLVYPNFYVSDTAVIEGKSGTANAVFTISLVDANDQTATVNYATFDGTAKAGVDYISKTGTLTFAPGVTSQTVSVAVKGDVLSEANETFYLKLSGAVNAAIKNPQGTGTINDDDPLPSMIISDVSVVEGKTGTTITAFLKVTLSTASGQAVSVNYATADGTAVEGADYQAKTGTLTFAPGTLTKTISIPINGDSLDEVNEKCFVHLSNAVGAINAKAQGTITITDDDAAPTMTVTSPAVTEGDEGTTNAVVTVTLSKISGRTVTVNYATADGTAKKDSDYQAQSGTLTFAPGTTVQTLTVPILGDTLDEPNEKVAINFSNVAGAVLSATQSAIVITDDDPLPGLSIDDLTITEGDSGTQSALLTVSLSAPSAKTVTVKYATANGTAKYDKDYLAKTGVLTFAPGVTTRKIAVPIIGEHLCENDETLLVNLSAPTNAELIDAQGTVTIADNDPLPSIKIGDVKVTEGNSGTVKATVTVTLSATCGRTVSVNYSTVDDTAKAGVDYTAKTGTLQFTPGVVTRTIPVTINCDTLDEYDNKFNVHLADTVNAVIGDADGAVTIVDDDAAATLSIRDVTIQEGNEGTAEAIVTVSLSKAVGRTVTANYATADGSAKAGSDYVAQTGTLTFAPGETIKTITLTVNNDLLDEANEKFYLNLSGITCAACTDLQGTVIITDDDAAPTLSIDDVSVTEGNSGTTYATFTVTLSAVSGKTVTVKYATANGTAKATYDYTAKTGTLTFAPGVTTQTIKVTVKCETLKEKDESFTVVLSGAVNATVSDGTGQAVIVNDDL